METVPIGRSFTLAASTEYALPPISVQVVAASGGALQTSLQSGGTFTTTTSTILTGAFIKSASGTATIKLIKNGVG